MRIFNPKESLLVQRWNLILLIISAAAVQIDPLFLYLLRINNSRTSPGTNMIELDLALVISAATLRSIADVFCGLLRVFFKFRAAFLDSVSATDRRYFLSFLVVDFLALLPSLQVIIVVGLISREAMRTRLLTTTITALHVAIFLQFVPRLLRFYQLYQDVKSPYPIRKAGFFRTAIAVFLYITAAHVIGAFWYSFSILRETDCWQLACRNHAGCDYITMLTNGNPGMDYWSFVNRTCPKRGTESSFEYGMFADAAKSGILESTSFGEKFFYSFWWGLQSLSTLGQNVTPSINSLEIGFAVCIFIAGLLLFSQVIAIIQSYHYIPPNLRRRLRRHQEYRWRTQEGVDFNHVLDSVPKDLRKDVKRCLWLPLLKKVPMFGKMDEQVLDAMCARLKPALYTKKSYIVREDDPVEEMLFIMSGELESVSTNGGTQSFYNVQNLKSGDFCGEELLTYVMTPDPLPILLFSPRTVQAVTEVQAFAISADDLNHVASKFSSQLNTQQFRNTFRYYSQQWTTWAVRFIQATWRQSKNKKLEEEAMRLGGDPPTSLAVAICASRFAANALQLMSRRISAQNARIS